MSWAIGKELEAPILPKDSPNWVNISPKYGPPTRSGVVDQVQQWSKKGLFREFLCHDKIRIGIVGALQGRGKGVGASYFAKTLP